MTLDCRLLDDLNLDSIKSGDLIARYAEHFGLTGELDPAEWTNASLAEIVALIAQRPSDHTSHARQDQPLNPSEVLRVLVDQTSRILAIPAADIPVDVPIGPDLPIGADELHQLLKATSEAFKLDLNLDLQPLLSRSPVQIAEIFTRIANAGNKDDPLSVINLPHTWVRELRIDVIESERPELPSWYGKRTKTNGPTPRS